jgi:hypothetical protein
LVKAAIALLNVKQHMAGAFQYWGKLGFGDGLSGQSNPESSACRATDRSH